MEQGPITGVRKEEQAAWIADSEPTAVKALQNLGIENLEAAFKIDSEKDNNKTDGQEGREVTEVADIYWVRFGRPKGFPDALPVEGKLYIPKTPKDETTLIHYAASFPQGNAGRFEEHYVYDFLNSGYAFFAGRHNGVSLLPNEDGEKKYDPTQIINAEKRLVIARKNNEIQIGEKREEGYLPTDINDEPITSMIALAPAFKRLHLLTQSFGASSHYNAVTRLAQAHRVILEKIGNIINIAGYVGKDKKDAQSIWDGTKISEDAFSSIQMGEIKRCSLNYIQDIDKLKESMWEIANRNARSIVPSNIGNIFFYTPRDPLITAPKDHTAESLRSYGPDNGRKVIVEDKRMTDEHKGRPHSMDWITSRDIINALELVVPEGDPMLRTLNNGESF